MDNEEQARIAISPVFAGTVISIVSSLLTALISMYGTTIMLKQEISFVRETLLRHERELDAQRAKIDNIGMRQNSVVAGADVIHESLDRRIRKLEK